MSLSEYVRKFAGRWEPRPVLEPVPQPVADGAPFSTPRPACVLMRGEQVLIDGTWRTIDRPECQQQSQGPTQTLLHLTDGQILGSRFDFTYISRDIDEQQLAAKENTL